MTSQSDPIALNELVLGEFVTARLAFDVVGPLPRTRSGFKYVLTCMCYASKYPDAVPMKRADAKAIAEAMMEKFSRTGLPDEILTDKGPSFEES